MSEREEHNELIHQLAERLRNHTEPYKDGAWERFAATHGKRRRKLWPYWSAAAMVLAAIGLYWFTRHASETTMPPQVVQQGVESRPLEPSERKDDIVGADTEAAADRPVVSAHNSGKEREQRRDVVKPVVGTHAVVHEETAEGDRASDRGTADQPAVLAVVAADTVVAAVPEARQLAVAIAPDEAEQPATDGRPDVAFNGDLANPDAYAARPQKPDHGMEKWDLGIVVSPSLTSEAVNIGGGFAIAYRISDKFSVGSGISVAELGVGENPGYQPQHEGVLNSPSTSDYFNGHSGLAVNYRREVSMTSNVVTLDIPLDLRYEVAKGFYTSVGLSYVAVLDEQRTGHYVDRLNKNTFATAQSSTANRLPSTEFVYSSEEISAKPLQGNGYAGYMNFSIGKKLPISRKLFLSVEPYFKLPIGRLSREEMNFTNEGIRIVTGF